MTPETCREPIVPEKSNPFVAGLDVMIALTGWLLNDPEMVPSDPFEELDSCERLRAMSRVNPEPSMLPLMSAIGKVEGIELGVEEPLDTPPVPEMFGTLSVAETGRPRALPTIEFTVGSIPPFPIHVIVAVPRPRGIVVNREISAMTGPAIIAASKPPEAAAAASLSCQWREAILDLRLPCVRGSDRPRESVTDTQLPVQVPQTFSV